MYLGRGIDQIDNISTLDNLSFNGSDATFNLTQNGVAFTPISSSALNIQIDGVIQSNNYSVNNATVTFDFVPSSSSVCNNIRHYGVGLLTTVSDSSITTAKLGNNSVGITQLNVSDGSNGQALTTNGSGTLAFSTVGVSGVSSASSSTALNIDSAGHITQPLQSAFVAHLGTTASNVTGDSTAYTIAGYQTEIADRNADFNATSGVFTAPVTGLYLLTFRFHLQNIASNHNDNQFKIETSNRSHPVLGELSSSSIGFSGSMNQTCSLIVDMDANDTAFLLVDFRGGSKTVDVHNDGFFMGYLLG